MVTNTRLKVLPAALMLALVACEDSITGVPDPVVEAAPAVEAVEAVALVNGGCIAPGAGLLSWWPGDDIFDDGDNFRDIAEPLDDASDILYASDAEGTRTNPSNGTVTLEAGKVGQAFRFTGSQGQPNHFLDVADVSEPNLSELQPQQFTVDLWAQRLGEGQGASDVVGNMLIQKSISDDARAGFSYYITWRGDGRITADVDFGGGVQFPGRLVSVGAPIPSLPTTTWVHVALTVDANRTATLYLNGVEQDSYTGSASVRYGSGSVTIGNNSKAYRNPPMPFQRSFNGLIDEVDIFDRALLASEIQAIHDAGSAGKCTGNNEAPVVGAVTGGPIDEGSLFETSVSFTDDSDSWTATVNYGDGTIENPVVSGMSVPLSHTYAQNDEYTVTVTVNDGELEGSSSATVVVNNVAPTVNVDPDATVHEGNVFELTGSFTDPGVDDSWTATVDYGDGTGIQPLDLTGMSFDLSHTYTTHQCSPFTVTVTVTDDDGAEDSRTAQVTVNYEYELSVEKAHVRLDRRRRHRRRSDRDHFDVEGRIPLSVLDCFDPETDAVTVSFESLEWVIDPVSFVRKDDKWEFKGPRREAGVRKFDLRDDGRFKIQARYLNIDLERDDFPREMGFSISIGPASGDTQIQLDRHGRLKKERPRRFRWPWER